MNVDEAVDWDAVAAIRASPRRQQVLDHLAAGPKYATEIAEEIDYSQVTVSKDFRWMKRRDPPLVQCFTPDRPHHVIYGLSVAGEAVVRHV